MSNLIYREQLGILRPTTPHAPRPPTTHRPPNDTPTPARPASPTWARTSALPRSLPGAPWLLGFALSAHSAKKPCEYTQASSPGVAPRLSPHNQLWGAGNPRQPRTGVPQGGPRRQGGTLPSLPPRAQLDLRPPTPSSLAAPLQVPGTSARLRKVGGKMALYLSKNLEYLKVHLDISARETR